MSRQIKQLKMACIFCKSELKNLERAKCSATHSDLLIAVDGGTKHLAALELKPNILVGEIDDVAADGVLKGDNIARIPHSPDKNKSHMPSVTGIAIFILFCPSLLVGFALCEVLQNAVSV